MKYITLVCAGGMSTSMLMKKMEKSAMEQGIEVTIVAMGEAYFPEYKGQTDVLLLGPQVSYVFDKMRAKYEPVGIKVGVIDMRDYGLMNGEKVLSTALSMLD